MISEATRLFAPRRPRDQPDRPGHHLLRRRPGAGRRRAGASAGAPGADRDAARKVDPLPLRLSQQDHPAPARHHGGASRPGEVHRHAAAARQRTGAEAHEARRVRRHFPQAAGAHPAHHSGRRHPHQLHRGISRRDGRGFRRAVPVRAGRALRQPGRIHLLRRRYQRQLSRWTARWTAARCTIASAG